MSCYTLFDGFDKQCEPPVKEYYQKILLINKKDVLFYNIQSDFEKNRIAFTLKDGLCGVPFFSNDKGSIISANFSKSTSDGIPLYNHNVNILVYGVEEEQKTLLKQLDNSIYFAVIAHKSGEVEVFGFEYGLKTKNYNYSGSSDNGGAVITLTSIYDEYEPPYNYLPLNIIAGQDPKKIALELFENDFCLTPNINNGDFNDDFSNDFDNTIQ